MKLFNCKVRIMGDVAHEVQRTAVTNAEIRILRSIHGDDGVVDIAPQDEADRSEAEERHRLEMFYGEPAVARLFGVARPSITDEPSSIEDVMGVAIPLEPPVRAEPKPVRAAPKAVQLEDVN